MLKRLYVDTRLSFGDKLCLKLLSNLNKNSYNVQKQHTCWKQSIFGWSKQWLRPEFSLCPGLSSYSTGRIYSCMWCPVYQTICSRFPCILKIKTKLSYQSTAERLKLSSEKPSLDALATRVRSPHLVQGKLRPELTGLLAWWKWKENILSFAWKVNLSTQNDAWYRCTFYFYN